MSTAMKCDRCRKCFDPYAIKESGYFMTITELFMQTGDQYVNREVLYRDEGINLCEECTDEFWIFWNEKGEKHDGEKAIDHPARNRAARRNRD